MVRLFEYQICFLLLFVCCQQLPDAGIHDAGYLSGEGSFRR